MSKLEKYKNKIGKKYGHLTLDTVEEIRSKLSDRVNLCFTFTCVCGNVRFLDSSGASGVFNKSTVSCGCVRKQKWARGYYAFQKSWKEMNEE